MLAVDIGGMVRYLGLSLPVAVVGMVGLFTVVQALVQLTDDLGFVEALMCPGQRSSDRSNSSTFAWIARIIVVVMSKVIQIRDVPDDVHAALANAASAQGISLTRYILRELEHLAKRVQAVHANAAVIRQTQAKVRGQVDRETILIALRNGRGD